jgi:hypothetical protein
MMTLIEDLSLTIQEICLTVGLSGAAVRVVPVVLLGFVMNVVALNLVGSLRLRHESSNRQHLLARISKAELKLARSAVSTSVKEIDETRRRLCSTEQLLLHLNNHPASSKTPINLGSFATASLDCAARALAASDFGLCETSCELVEHAA